MQDQTTQDLGASSHGGGAPAGASVPSLVILWSAEEPARAGEVAFVSGSDGSVLGRGESAGAERLRFAPQRPGPVRAPRSIEGRGISREQLRIERRGERLRVRRVGRCSMLVDGVERDDAELTPGSSILLDRQLLLLYVVRPAVIRPPARYPIDATRFCEPDELGILGESPAVWALRVQIEFVAATGRHVLVTGPSGSGKELAGRAIHALSPRAAGPWIARNAATVPASLVDAELFGNRKDYPNPGMQERPGLVGAAHQGTLFLDEIGETSAELQAHLLRVLDAGEYHRLGEEHPRRTDLRLVAATNRDPSSLKHDLAARLLLRVAVPGLDERREDVPLLARVIVARAAAERASPVTRFVDPTPSGLHARLAPKLVDALTRHAYTLHVRELEALLWRAMETSTGDSLELTAAVRDALRPAARGDASNAAAEEARTPTREDVVEALERAGGNQNRAFKTLGLASRFALYRLMKKYGLKEA